MSNIITLVSTAANRQGNELSRQPSISADGAKIAFYSDAFNLVAGDGNADVFVKDPSTVNTAPTALTFSANLVAENATVGLAVGTLTASDPDAGDTAAFSLVSGAGDTDNAAFAMGRRRPHARPGIHRRRCERSADPGPAHAVLHGRRG